MKAGEVSEEVGGCVDAIALCVVRLCWGLLWARVRGGVCERPRAGVPPIG